MRRGEALALAWTDLDLDAGTARVRHTLSRLSDGLTLSRPKTERSRRVVMLPAQSVEALRVLRVRLLELGENTRIVSDLLGHSSTAITADVYQHVEDRMRVRAASKLEGVLGAALSS